MSVWLKLKTLLNRTMPRCCAVHGCVEVFVLFVMNLKKLAGEHVHTVTDL